MPKPSEGFSDLRFPVNGIDLSTGFAGQRPQTTPAGVNVRTFEPGEDRARGGSRPGLARFIDEQLPLP